MTMTKRQNQYLFVVFDNFAKFVCIKPMRTAKAENVARFLEDALFLNFLSICDNGVQFASKGLAKLMREFNDSLKFIPFYYPQANP